MNVENNHSFLDENEAGLRVTEFFDQEIEAVSYRIEHIDETAELTHILTLNKKELTELVKTLQEKFNL